MLGDMVPHTMVTSTHCVNSRASNVAPMHRTAAVSSCVTSCSTVVCFTVLRVSTGAHRISAQSEQDFLVPTSKGAHRAWSAGTWRGACTRRMMAAGTQFSLFNSQALLKPDTAIAPHAEIGQVLEALWLLTQSGNSACLPAVSTSKCLCDSAGRMAKADCS